MDDHVEAKCAGRGYFGSHEMFGEHVAVPSLDEIRYAEQLRLQIRESYMRLPGLPPLPWSVGLDLL